MAQIIRGTTPTIEYTFKKVAVSDITTAIFTVKQHGEVLIERDLTTADVSEDSISWMLSQEECLTLELGRAALMVNWLTGDGTRGASNEVPVDVIQNHIPEVIT